MSDSRNQMNQTEFSDVTIRQFLLAQLNAETQTAFEESLFVDDKLEQRVQFSEYELADDYAFERLKHSEKQLFEKHFRVTAARNVQLIVSVDLRDRFAAAVTPCSKISFAERVRSLFNLKQPVWRIAFVAALLFLLVGAIWLVIKKEPQIKEQIAKRLSKKPAQIKSSPSESNHPVGNATPQHENGPSMSPQHEQPVEPQINVSLTSDVAPEKTPSIVIKEDDQRLVHFQLALKSDQLKEYQAEVMDAQGQSVISGGATAASPGTLRFDVPAKLLKSGWYQIKVLDSRSNALIATYYFRVQ